MRNEEIFNLAETHGWMDDFGRWNFKDEGLIGFVLELLSLETKPETSTVSEKQEPAAWAEITKDYVAVSDEPFENAIPLYTEPQKVHEISMKEPT